MKMLLLLCLTLSFTGLGQSSFEKYSILLEPVTIDGLMGLQSYSVGQANGEWLISGGRLDGLHRRQPWAAFDSLGHNDQLIVVNPQTKQVWKARYDNFPADLRDQLKSTNSAFYQDGEQMLIAGGYGLSETAGDHITFPGLITFNIAGVIAAVKANELKPELFSVFKNDNFAVTGAQMNMLSEIYVLAGGHRFDGRYNPNDGPSFTQTYSGKAYLFTFRHGELIWLEKYEDPEQLHRRDFNLAKTLDAKGNTRLTVFSGVFREDADLPFLTASHITIDSNLKVAAQPGFEQFYNHYHCPDVSIYDSKTQENHVIFFGGLSQFYDSLEILKDGDQAIKHTLVQDNNVPFTDAISVVTLDTSGQMTEYLTGMHMPFLLGAGAEFIPDLSLPDYKNGIFILSDSTKSLRLGMIYGGIASSAKNIFWTHEGDESTAFNGLFEVLLIPKSDALYQNPQSNRDLPDNPDFTASIEEHPAKYRYQIKYTIPMAKFVRVEWTSPNGKTYSKGLTFQQSGEYTFKKLLPKRPGTYLVKITADTGKGTITSWERYFIVE